MSRDPGTAVGDPQHCSQSARVKKTCPAEIVEKETNAEPHTTQITELNPETWRHSTGGKLTQMTMQKNPAAEKLPEPSGTWEGVATVSSGVSQFSYRFKGLKATNELAGQWDRCIVLNSTTLHRPGMLIYKVPISTHSRTRGTRYWLQSKYSEEQLKQVGNENFTDGLSGASSTGPSRCEAGALSTTPPRSQWEWRYTWR